MTPVPVLGQTDGKWRYRRGHATEIREIQESLHANRRSDVPGAVQGAEIGGPDSEQVYRLCKCGEDKKGRGGD